MPCGRWVLHLKLEPKLDPLVEIDAVVPWEAFRPALERVWRPHEVDPLDQALEDVAVARRDGSRKHVLGPQVDAQLAAIGAAAMPEIGRASCRERVSGLV